MDSGTRGLRRDESPATRSSEPLALKRRLGLSNAVSLIVSVMIGAGIFVSPSSALKRAGSVGEALTVWAVCGVISMLGALSFAELGTVVAQSGAEYSYFRAAYSPLHPRWGALPAFLFAWVVVLLLRPAEAAVIIMVFAEYSTDMFFNEDSCAVARKQAETLVAVCALALITYINTHSVHKFMKMQSIFSSCKIFVCAIVIGGGMYNLSKGNFENLSKGFEGSKTGIKDIILSIYSGLWAYDGWSSVAMVSEEIIEPNKNIPLSIVIALPLVTALFTLMNVAYMSVLTVEEMVSAPAVADVFGARVLGPLRFIIPVGVALSTFSCSMASQFGTARLTFAAGREGHLLKSLSYLHVRKYTPAPSVILHGFMTLLFVLYGDIVALIEFASFLIWTFYGLAFAALIVLRRTKSDVPRPYKVPIAIPVILVVLSAAIAAVPILINPSPGHLGAVGFIALGALVYYPFVYRRYRLPGIERLHYLIQVLLEVAPSVKPPEL